MKEPVVFECGRIEFVTDRIIKITMTVPEATVPQLEEYFQKLDEVLKSFDKPFVVVSDTSVSKWLGGEERIALAKMIKDIELRYHDRFKKSFLVFHKPILKALLKGVNLVSPPIVPQVIFKSLEPAITAAHDEVNSWG